MRNLNVDVGAAGNCPVEELVITITGSKCRLQDLQMILEHEIRQFVAEKKVLDAKIRERNANVPQ